MPKNYDGVEIVENKVGETLIYYDNALANSLCDEIHSFYYTNYNCASPGITVGGENKSVKNTMDIATLEDVPVNLREEYLKIDQKIYQSLKTVTEMYLSRFEYLAKAPNLQDTGYLWQMYVQNDGFYKEHIDGEQWNESVRRRVVAVIAYINTVEEGGETYFKYQDVYVKPVKGRVALFPTDWSHPHQAMVPKSSNKLILSSFIETRY